MLMLGDGQAGRQADRSTEADRAGGQVGSSCA